MTISVQITKIECTTTSEMANSGGADEVFLICQSDGGATLRYPYPPFKTNSMDNGDTWLLDGTDWPELVLEFIHDVNVTLWDQDIKIDPNQTDFIGNFCVNGSDMASPVEITNGDKSQYTVHFKTV